MTTALGARRRGCARRRRAPRGRCGRPPSRGPAGPGRRAATWRRLPGSSRARQAPAFAGRVGERDGTASRPAAGRFRNEPDGSPRHTRSSAATSAAPPPRGVMQQELVERARRGDHDAFAALAGAAIFRLDAAARLILRDPDQAKDAVQETLVRAWRDLPTLRSPDRFDAWLHRLLYRACIDEARRLRRHRVDVELTPDRRAVGRRRARRRSTTATSSNAASAASSRRRGPSSSFITISTCHCRRSPSRSGSRSGRRNRACTERSSPCERRSTPMPDLGRRSRRAVWHDAQRWLRTDRLGLARRAGWARHARLPRRGPRPDDPDPTAAVHGRASKGGSPWI